MKATEKEEEDNEPATAAAASAATIPKSKENDETSDDTTKTKALLPLLPIIDEQRKSTDTIGRLGTHRRVQSSTILSSMFLDSPVTLQHRGRSMSLNQQPPSLQKFYPGSHLLETDDCFVDQGSCRYLSLWLLPPPDILEPLSKEIAKLSLRYNRHGSSAPFMPHITIVGSIKCDTLQQARDLGVQLQNGLQGTGTVPCRFVGNCVAMHDEQGELVWSQACIAIMERSQEYMQLLARARDILGLPPGEWMFPGGEPHYSKFYGHRSILQSSTTTPSSTADDGILVIPPPDDFVAETAALFLTTPGTVEGVRQWREITRINLLPL